MIAWFAKNDVAANLLMFTIIIVGVLAMKSGMKMEVFPPSDPETVSVSVPLRGGTPEDVELGITVRIEEAVQDLVGIEQIVSTSSEGRSSVRIEIDQDYDPRELLNDIKARVDAINTFPTDTERPVISLAQRIRDVISVAVSGDFREEEVRLYAEQVRDDLLRLDGVTQVELDSVRRYEIGIEASQDRLRDFDLTLADIAQAVRGSSLDISAGNVRTDGGDVLIRSKGQAYRQGDFDAIVVKTNPDGSIIRLSDVATVNDSFEESALRTRFNGKNAAMVEVFRTGNQNAIDVADAVKQYVDDKQKFLPVGMELTYWDDDSEILIRRLSTLTINGIQGGLLVILLLTLFLRPAIAIWVFIGIPISFLGALGTMYLAGMSLNVMALFGFIVVLGIVVDDAIVTGENVYSRMRDGEEGVVASINGTRQVAIPVTFGILTTMAAFAPLAFIEGRLGDVFAPVGLVVIPVLLFSLVESKLVLPAHLKHVKLGVGADKTGFSRWQSKFADNFEHFIIRRYRPLLDKAARNRYSVIAGFIGIFVITLAIIMSGWTRFTFWPRIGSDSAAVTLTMPVGTPFEVTDRYMRRIIDAAMELQEEYTDGKGGEPIFRQILAMTGSAGRTSASHLGMVRVETIPTSERSVDVTTQEIVQEWQQKIGELPGAESLTMRAEYFRAGDPIDLQFSGHSLEEMSEVAEKVKDRIATYPGTYEISDSLSDGKEELHVELTQQGHVLGLTRSDILGQVGQAFKGFEVQRIQRGRDDVRVIVRLPETERSTLATLDEFLITAPNGRQIPLAHVARLTPGKGPSTIRRVDRYRVLNVTADVDKDNTNMTTLTEDLTAWVDELLTQYPGISYTLEGEARQQRDSFDSLGVGLAIVLFAMYCLLALPLKSYLEPLVVMSVIPFGLIGAVVGHWIMGYDLSMMSLLGLMALTGVVVNDSLVLVDFINQQRAKGVQIVEAVLTSGVKRFRPVMLTSLTTFFGLLPVMLSTSQDARFLVPMAISLGFGILFATMVTLIAVPLNILIVEDLKNWCLRLVGREQGPGTHPDKPQTVTG